MDKALLVGINRYPVAPLAGCVNDVGDMASYLVSHQGFKMEDVRLLVDERATRQAILERLEWLVKVKGDSRVFFHFSGHGVQFPTRDFECEIDGLLEAVCPVDFDWDLERMITDKDLVAIFSKVPSGTRFSWVNDSCHSGDLTKNMPCPSLPLMVPRSYPVPLDISWRRSICVEKGVKSAERAVVCDKLDVGFVSGCRSDQTSADTSVNGRPCGALTHYFLENLKTNKHAPLDTIVDATSKHLAQVGYSQRPQAEGRRKNKPFLG